VQTLYGWASAFSGMMAYLKSDQDLDRLVNLQSSRPLEILTAGRHRGPNVSRYGFQLNSDVVVYTPVNMPKL